MSLNQNMILMRDVTQFDEGVAEFIALEVAKGNSISELHDCYPDRVPNPIIVNRWRDRVVQFNLLMTEAEMAKAERLVDETIRISDADDRNAASAANAIKSRHWLAGKLSERFAPVPKKPAGAGMVGVILTDEQLMAIAAQGLPALPGESERVDREPDPVASRYSASRARLGLPESDADDTDTDPLSF